MARKARVAARLRQICQHCKVAHRGNEQKCAAAEFIYMPREGWEGVLARVPKEPPRQGPKAFVDANGLPYLTPSIPYALSSEAALLSNHVGHRLDDFKIRHSWFAYVPNYIGQGATVDASAQAAVTAIEYYYRRDANSAQVATRRKAEAITALRTNLDSSDASLMSVALIIFAETVVANFTLAQQTPHLDGFRAILAARPAGSKLSDFGNYLIWQSIDKEFLFACGTGKASGWDAPRWESFDFQTPSAAPHLAKIQKLMTKLAIKVPRAIAAVRAVREAARLRLHSADVVEAGRLVQEVLELEDAVAESQLLHRVKVTATPPDLAKRCIMPSTYTFQSFDEFIAAIHYWYLRLVAIKLRFILHQNEQAQPDLMTSERSSTSVISTSSRVTETEEDELESLRAEQIRLTANVIMSWETGHSDSIDPKCRQIALLVVWSALVDMPTFRKSPSSVVRSWVLRAYRDLHAGAEIDSQTMDKSADLLAGGPRMGMLAHVPSIRSHAEVRR